MELVVFDLDGTLLNGESEISAYTSETLKLLSARKIAYTIATGRTLHGAREVIDGHGFLLPQAYKNGVMIWHPETLRYSSEVTLTPEEVDSVLNACHSNGITPFVFTLDTDLGSSVYHALPLAGIEQKLVRSISRAEQTRVRAIEELPADAVVTHVNAIGHRESIGAVFSSVSEEAHLVAYCGTAWEGQEWRWLDIHHVDASKGGAVTLLKRMLGVERVVCFGDSDNDLSMFEAADESYAPANANARLRSAATAVIGHHDEEGIAQFLRERFALD